MTQYNLVILFSSLFFINSLFANPIKIPKFSDYPVQVYNGKSAVLNSSDKFVQNYKTRLNSAIKENPNFAGEYVIATWGCGTGCKLYTFINKRTGNFLDQDFGGELGEIISSSKANSRLLITKSELFADDYESLGYMTHYYILERSKLKKIAEHPITREEYFAY